MNPCTYVILLNWNGRDHTLECLPGLLQDESLSLIICDNGSEDGSLDAFAVFLAERYPERRVQMQDRADISLLSPGPAGCVYLLRNGANLGFAGGNNPGIRLALRDPACRYVWLLNNDTTVQADTLAKAVARMEQDSRIGICGSSLVYAHTPGVLQAFGGAVYSRWSGRSRHIGAFSRFEDIPVSPEAVECDMSYVVGASMLVRREFIESVGLMQEDYFLYYEEADWAERGKGRFRLGYAPESIVFHKEGASIGTSASGGSPLSVFYLFRNRLRFTWRYHRFFLPSVVAFVALDLLRFVLKGRWPQALAALRGVLQAAPPAPRFRKGAS